MWAEYCSSIAMASVLESMGKFGKLGKLEIVAIARCVCGCWGEIQGYTAARRALIYVRARG